MQKGEQSDDGVVAIVGCDEDLFTAEDLHGNT